MKFDTAGIKSAGMKSAGMKSAGVVANCLLCKLTYAQAFEQGKKTYRNIQQYNIITLKARISACNSRTL